MTIQLKSADQTHYDAIALGEVLMRIDPAKCPRRGAHRSDLARGRRDQCRRGVELLLWLTGRCYHGSCGRWDWPQHRKPNCAKQDWTLGISSG